MTDLFPDDRSRRRPVQPTAVPWTCDAGVPVGIREDARRIGARGCFVRGELVLVLLASGKECWLNHRGEQVGHAPGGRKVELLEEVPWPLASVSERTRAA